MYGPKPKEETPSKTPLHIYICGHVTSETKTQLLHELSKQLFVKQNNENIALFVDQCYFLMESSVFVYILDSISIVDKYCLSLLGMAIALDIPIITIRNMGYTLPLQLPAHFATTEIVNRKNKVTAPKNELETITTLDKAMRVLFATSLIYHQEISGKCVTEINAIVSNKTLREAQHFMYLYQEYTKGKIAVNTTQKAQMTWNANNDILIENNGSDVATTNGNNHGNNNGTINNNISSNNKDKPTKEVNGKKGDGSPAVESKSTHKLVKHKSSSFISTGSLGANEYKNERRKSSLPEMKRNYLVSSKPGNAEVLPFPSSPSLYQRYINRAIHDEVLEEDEDKSICLSRACTPPDFLENDNDWDLDII